MIAKTASPERPAAKKKPEEPPAARKALQTAKKISENWRAFVAFFRDDDVGGKDVIENEAATRARCQSLQKKVVVQSYAILGLLIAVIALIPVLQPIYRYEAIEEGSKARQSLIPLPMPVLTDQAILSWSATSITEILTFGFGDFDQRMLGHRDLFTDEGWETFTSAIRDQDMRQTFKLRQLVLTSVPANQPVIVGKGEGRDHLYQWLVEMPVVMTYTTNNNVTSRQKGIVRLTIVRVPPSQNEAGIGIKTWQIL